MPPEGNTRAGILPSYPSLDRGSRSADIGFELRTFRSVVAIKIAKSVVDKDGRTQTTVVSPADPVTSFHIYEKCCFDRRAFDTCASRQKPICRRRYEDLRLVDALRLHNSDFKSPLTKMLGSSSSRHIQSSRHVTMYGELSKIFPTNLVDLICAGEIVSTHEEQKAEAKLEKLTSHPGLRQVVRTHEV
ncbi:hypothetical protein T265_09817 [Opisthorchis viverrini]|uniref:Uncharacterized protein n=1 Tax=Opisthorchis viverrini TaxID=6198 RepID=A0A074Z8S6_OPIVI|nr:hypothetical protein T265_09817 [Opisthorchis viverrini]KER21987.1 hypothetical protein T265_09817 [Opisthorchis viverrini]